MTPAIPFARGELSVTTGVCKLLMGGTWRFVRLFLFASWAFLCLCPPTIQFDWRAASGDKVTFPFGPTVGKVVKFGGVAPVKFELQGLYVPVHPDNDGSRFIVQFNIIPVIPAALDGPLYASR
jgi:hypothetical protein